jgi:HPr Serine kinase C-terminal domain
VILHAGLIAMRRQGIWCGVLIEGMSGAGKSDLALRMIDVGWRLVADDRVLVWPSGGRLYGRVPDVLSGKIEARGIDILMEASLPHCRVCLSVADGRPERRPEPQSACYLGRHVPQLILPLLEGSTPAKIARAMWRLGASDEGAYLGDRAGVNSPLSGGDSR